MQVISQERDESMQSLLEEIEELKETNKELQTTVEELRLKLEQQGVGFLPCYPLILSWYFHLRKDQCISALHNWILMQALEALAL